MRSGLESSGFSSLYSARRGAYAKAGNYVWERELYIAWNVASPDAQGQTVFRLLQGALEGAEPNRLLAVEKAAGHRGWGKETVYVFGRDAVDAFLDVVMAEEIGGRGQ